MVNNFYVQKDINSECVYGVGAREDVQLTIVIPTYKRIDLLTETIKSILRQTQPQKIKYQVLIVSNDEEFDVTKLGLNLDPEIYSIYCNESNLGMVGNMNRCAVLAKGEFVAYMQDDDLFYGDYLIEFEKLYLENKLKNIDCLIPNRYYFYDVTNKKSQFGNKAYKRQKIKKIVNLIICIGKSKEKEFRKVTKLDCIRVWDNIFGGGPTCGIVFKKESLMDSMGFDFEYPYAFDSVFFRQFSEKHNVCLYNKYLSVYRMVDSASNNPKVQYDFFRSSMLLLEQSKTYKTWINYFENEVSRYNVEGRNADVQEIIRNNSNIEYKRNNLKYLIFRAIRFVLLVRSGLYRRELISKDEI